VLAINRAAKPQAANDVLPNTWLGGAEELAKASAAGDSFHATIKLPADFAANPIVHVYSLGESETLGTRSVDPGTFTVHEVKVKSKSLNASEEHQFEYTFAPHSAVLFELESH
jgi:hypothetical protein